MAVILLTVTLSVAVERYVSKNQSAERVSETIEKLIDFRDELAAMLANEALTDAAELLLSSPKYQEQFFVFDRYGNEILDREIPMPKAPHSRFNHRLADVFAARDIPLVIDVHSIFNQQYSIETRPLMLFKPFFSPRTAGTVIRLTLLILFCALVCYFLAWRFTRAIKQLRSATQKIAAGNYEAFPDTIQFSRDELGQLGEDFQYMAQQLRDSTEQKKQMLSDISHELRSPLARMQVALEITRSQHPEIQPALARIEKESNRMTALIEQILSIQKAQTAAETSPKKSVDIHALINAIIQDVRYEYQQTHKRITLAANRPIPPILGNAEALHSALENVIRNAMSHTADNSTVHVSLTHHQQRLTITVDDAGKGIPEDKLAAIFQPFTRLDSSRNRSTGGYGLGLSISHAIINKHQGNITANNRYNTDNQVLGLSVSINLPTLVSLRGTT